MKTLKELTQEITDLIEDKKKGYGDSVSFTEQAYWTLFPNDIPIEKYGDVLLVVRILDKISRIANQTKVKDLRESWSDIAGYALRALERLEQLDEMDKAGI